MEKVLIFGNTHESREAAQTMRRRGKQVIVCVTTEFARTQLPAGTICHVGRFDRAEMLSFIRQVNPSKVIDATHPYALTAQENIRLATEQLAIPCQRTEIKNAREAWRDAVQWMNTPEEAVAALSGLPEENILLAGDYQYLPHYVPHLNKEHLFCRIVPTVESMELVRSLDLPESHVVAACAPYTRDFNSAIFDMLDIDVLVMRDVVLDNCLAECVIPALERQMDVIMVRDA